MKTRIGGTTLIELLMVIIVVGVLAGFLLSAISKGQRNTAISNTKSTAKIIGRMLQELCRTNYEAVKTQMVIGASGSCLEVYDDKSDLTMVRLGDNYPNQAKIIQLLIDKKLITGEAGTTLDSWGKQFTYKIFPVQTEGSIWKRKDWQGVQVNENTLMIHSAGPDGKWYVPGSENHIDLENDDIVEYFPLDIVF